MVLIAHRDGAKYFEKYSVTLQVLEIANLL